MLSMVVLPAPDGPITARTCPADTDADTLETSLFSVALAPQHRSAAGSGTNLAQRLLGAMVSVYEHSMKASSVCSPPERSLRAASLEPRFAKSCRLTVGWLCSGTAATLVMRIWRIWSMSPTSTSAVASGSKPSSLASVACEESPVPCAAAAGSTCRTGPSTAALSPLRGGFFLAAGAEGAVPPEQRRLSCTTKRSFQQTAIATM